MGCNCQFVLKLLIFFFIKLEQTSKLMSASILHQVTIPLEADDRTQKEREKKTGESFVLVADTHRTLSLRPIYKLHKKKLRSSSSFILHVVLCHA